MAPVIALPRSPAVRGSVCSVPGLRSCPCSVDQESNSCASGTAPEQLETVKTRQAVHDEHNDEPACDGTEHAERY